MSYTPEVCISYKWEEIKGHRYVHMSLQECPLPSIRHLQEPLGLQGSETPKKSEESLPGTGPPESLDFGPESAQNCNRKSPQFSVASIPVASQTTVGMLFFSFKESQKKGAIACDFMVSHSKIVRIWG